jgi:hypothetical protein
MNYFEGEIIDSVLQGWVLPHVFTPVSRAHVKISSRGILCQSMRLQARFWVRLFPISNSCVYPFRGVKNIRSKERVSTHTQLPRVLTWMPRCKELNIAT